MTFSNHACRTNMVSYNVTVITSGSSLHRENRENGKKKFPVREYGNLTKTQGILFSQVLDFLILTCKNQEIALL